MKKFTSVISGLILTGALTGCGGGGGGGSSTYVSGPTLVLNGTMNTAYLSNGDLLIGSAGVFTNQVTGETLLDQGGGVYWNTNTGAYVTHVTGGSSKDVDLAKAEYEQGNTEVLAKTVANKFGMSFESAAQLVDLSKQIKRMAKGGQLTEADSRAVTTAALNIAGVSMNELNDVVNSAVQGDEKAANALLEKAAHRMGMSGGSALRDQLLPALGVNLDQ